MNQKSLSLVRGFLYGNISTLVIGSFVLLIMVIEDKGVITANTNISVSVYQIILAIFIRSIFSGLNDAYIRGKGYGGGRNSYIRFNRMTDIIISFMVVLLLMIIIIMLYSSIITNYEILALICYVVILFVVAVLQSKY